MRWVMGEGGGEREGVRRGGGEKARRTVGTV